MTRSNLKILNLKAPTLKVLIAAGAGALVAGAAQAQPGTGYEVVPAAQRLTLPRVFADAAIEVKLLMAVLVISVVAALVIWAMSLGKVGQGDAKGLAGALGRLRIVRSGGFPLGALAASYTLLMGFIGMANVRPTPTVAVLAPGWAEAALAVMLGLLATAVAVLCERHLEGRIRRAAA